MKRRERLQAAYKVFSEERSKAHEEKLGPPSPYAEVGFLIFVIGTPVSLILFICFQSMTAGAILMAIVIWSSCLQIKESLTAGEYAVVVPNSEAWINELGEYLHDSGVVLETLNPKYDPGKFYSRPESVSPSGARRVDPSIIYLGEATIQGIKKADLEIYDGGGQIYLHSSKAQIYPRN